MSWRATQNPIDRFRTRFEDDLVALRQAGLPVFHKWAFAGLRQLGAAAALAAWSAGWAMVALMPAEVWYVLSVLLAPIGYVIQDTVADAMTVEAVPRIDERGQPIGEARLKLMHTTMQTLGRVAIIGGGILVALINLYVFTGVENLPQEQIAGIYQQVYLMALVIPAVSVLGVIAASILRVREKRRLLEQGQRARGSRDCEDGR